MRTTITALFLLAALLDAGAGRCDQETPEVLVEKAIYLEETVGDLQAASALYQQIIDDDQANRPHVAQAWLRLGLCHLKNGRDQEARKAFDQLLAHFSDQEAAAARASMELARLSPPLTVPELEGCRLKEKVSLCFAELDEDDKPEAQTIYENSILEIEWDRLIAPSGPPDALALIVRAPDTDDEEAHDAWAELIPPSAKSTLYAQSWPQVQDPKEVPASPLKPGRYTLALLPLQRRTYEWVDWDGEPRKKPGLFEMGDDQVAELIVKPAIPTQILLADMRPDGSARFALISQEMNRSEQTVDQGDFIAPGAIQIHTMQDEAGRDLSFTMKQAGGLPRYFYRLKEPVAPGRPILLRCEGLLAGAAAKNASAAQVYEARFDNWPEVGAPARWLEIYRLPEGAEVLEISPAEMVRRVREGRTEVLIEQIADPGAKKAVSIKYALSEKVRPPIEMPGTSPGVDTWIQRLKEARDHKQAAFVLVPDLIANLSPDQAFQVVKAAWPALQNDEVKTGIAKAFAFRDHPRVLDVLHLGMTDSDVIVRRYVRTYVSWYAFHDFAEDYRAYDPWYRQNAGQPLETVVLRNGKALAAALMVASKKEAPGLIELLTAHLDLSHFPAFADYLATSGLAESAITWLSEPGADSRLTQAAGRLLDLLSPDDAFLQAKVLPLLGTAHPDAVRAQAAMLLAHSQDDWAVDALIAHLIEAVQPPSKGRRGILWSLARALAEADDPRAIPSMIGAIAADNTYDTVYGVGYFGLSKMTGVSYDEKHDGEWWRRWWERNKDEFSETVQRLEIPEIQVSRAEDRALERTWFMAGRAPGSYEMDLNSGVTFNGAAAFSLRNIEPTPRGFATMMRELPPGDWRGKRICLSTHLKSEAISGWVGLWMRIDGQDREVLGFDNMSDRPIKGTTDWTEYKVVLDVKEAAANVAYGLIILGTGQVWFSDPVISIVDTDVPVTGIDLGGEG